MLLGFANMVIGNEEHNSHITYSSGEEIDCDSNCSLCASDNKSISLLSSSRGSIQRSFVSKTKRLKMNSNDQSQLENKEIVLDH